MGLFQLLLWIVVVQSTLSITGIDGQESSNVSTISVNTTEISTPSADFDTVPKHTTLSNSESKELTSEKLVTTYTIAENETATYLTNDSIGVTSHVPPENESTSVSCGLGENCGDNKTKFTSELSAFTTDSVLPTKSDDRTTTDNTETPSLSPYQVSNITRNSEQHDTNETTEIPNLDATTNLNHTSTENSYENNSLEATDGSDVPQTWDFISSKESFNSTSTLLKQEVKKSLNFTSDSNSGLTTSSNENVYISSDGNAASEETTSNVSIIITTDEENMNRSTYIPPVSKLTNTANPDISKSPAQTSIPDFPTIHSTTSEANSKMLNSTQRYSTIPYEGSQTDEDESTPPKSLIFSTTLHDPAHLSIETTVSYSDQTSTVTIDYGELDILPPIQSISDEANEIADKTVLKPPISVTLKKPIFSNSSGVPIEELTVTSTDNVTASFTSIIEMSTSVIEMSTSVTEINTSVTEEMPSITASQKSNLTQYPKEDDQTSKTAHAVPYSLEEGLTEPRVKDDLTGLTFPVINRRPSINKTETTKLTTDVDGHIFNTDSLPVNNTLSPDEQYTDNDDATRSRVSNRISTSPIATNTSTTVEESSSEVERKTFTESVSKGVSTISPVLNSTQYTKSTRMPKILTIVNDSVTTTILLSITNTQENLTSSQDSLSSNFANEITDFEDFTSTETWLELTERTTVFTTQNESSMTVELIFNRIPVEDLKEFDSRNAMTASFAIIIKKSDKEWLNNRTMIFQTWLLKTRVQNLSMNWTNEEEKNLIFHSFNILYILPTPYIYNNQLVFSFIVKNILNNESIPTEILIPILTSNADEICNLLNATESIFVPFYSNLTMLKEGGILEKLRNEYGVIYIAVSIVFLIMLILFLAIVSCIKCKKQGSADFQFDKVNLERDMHLALDMGHVNSALSNFHEEDCKKSSFSNGLQMCSVDDNEGWLVPMGEKPIIDLNAPASQDTPM